MIWVIIYLYIVGATMMWWFARAQFEKHLASKIAATILWPILVPIVALWG